MIKLKSAPDEKPQSSNEATALAASSDVFNKCPVGAKHYDF